MQGFLLESYHKAFCLVFCSYTEIWSTCFWSHLGACSPTPPICRIIYERLFSSEVGLFSKPASTLHLADYNLFLFCSSVVEAVAKRILPPLLSAGTYSCSSGTLWNQISAQSLISQVCTVYSHTKAGLMERWSVVMISSTFRRPPFSYVRKRG